MLQFKGVTRMMLALDEGKKEITQEGKESIFFRKIAVSDGAQLIKCTIAKEIIDITLEPLKFYNVTWELVQDSVKDATYKFKVTNLELCK